MAVAQPQAVYVQNSTVIAPWMQALPPVNGMFSTGFCDCCQPECGTCCYGCCCISCQIGDLAAMFKPGEPACCAGNYMGACCAHYWLGGFGSGWGGFTLLGWIVSCPLRGDVRNKWQIQGDSCQDCCMVFFCDACAAIQEYKEMQIRFAYQTQASPAQVVAPVMVAPAQAVAPTGQVVAPAPQQVPVQPPPPAAPAAKMYQQA